ncbi:MAG: signal peptidase I [Methanosarcinales archaeon Met12]|nr:MAG: signal peptidase I [Methanosarcinales archaeon Met12]
MIETNFIIYVGILSTIFFVIYLVKKRDVKYPLTLLGKLIGMLTPKREERIDAVMQGYKFISTRPRVISSVLPLINVLMVGLILYFGIIGFVVIGSDSMAPTFEKGDLLVMQSVLIDPVAGDIIMFDAPGVAIPVVHRVYSIGGEGDWFRTKGDARPVDLWAIPKDDIKGQAVMIHGEPIVLRDVGIYFIEDPRQPHVFGTEFGFITSLVQTVQTSGLILFFLMIALYVLMTLKEFHSKAFSRYDGKG